MDIKKYIEIIEGNDNYLRRVASKNIVRQGLFSPEILAAVNRTLLNEFKIDLKEFNDSRKEASHHIDVIAWFCKILGASGATDYIPTLEYVEKESDNKKIKGFAKSNLERLEEIASSGLAPQ